MKFARKTMTLLRIMSTLPFGVLLKKIPKPLVPVAEISCKTLLWIVPIRLYRFFPKNLTFLILTSANWLKLEKLRKLSPKDLNIDAINNNPIGDFFKTLHYLRTGELPIDDKSFASPSSKYQEKQIMELMKWVVWHAGHRDIEKFTSKVIHFLQENSELGVYKRNVNVRYLRDFCSNMGHLALLFLYVKKYGETNRVLIVPDRKPANQFFYELVKSESPLKIIEKSQGEFSQLPLSEIDTFQYSLDAYGKFGVEPEGVSFPIMEFQEYNLTNGKVLKLSDEENELGKCILSKQIGYTPSWFAILHVREPENGNIRFSQARDANVSTYALLAKSVTEAGGLVIRMGDKRFPKLPKNFMGFDYAHSDFRSDFFDVWLWANCRFWVGNISGAAFPPICFGKPRLLTNQWHWYLHGPSHDFVLRKKLIDLSNNQQECDVRRVLESQFSRIQDRGWLERFGYKVLENTAYELDQAFKIFFDFNFGNKSMFKGREKTREQEYIESVLSTPSRSTTMNLIS